MTVIQVHKRARYHAGWHTYNVPGNLRNGWSGRGPTQTLHNGCWNVPDYTYNPRGSNWWIMAGCYNEYDYFGNLIAPSNPYSINSTVGCDAMNYTNGAHAPYDSCVASF